MTDQPDPTDADLREKALRIAAGVATATEQANTTVERAEAYLRFLRKGRLSLVPPSLTPEQIEQARIDALSRPRPSTLRAMIDHNKPRDFLRSPPTGISFAYLQCARAAAKPKPPA